MTLNELNEVVITVYRQMLSDIAIEYPEHTSDLLIKIGTIPRSINLGSLYREKDVSVVWDSISEYPEGILRNAFMTASARLKLRLTGADYVSETEIQKETWDNIIFLVAGSLGHFRDNNTGSTVMNTDFKERGQPTETWVGVLRANQWFIFILLLRLLSIDFIDDMQKMLDSVQKRRTRKAGNNEAATTDRA